jgi:hypothetical protein
MYFNEILCESILKSVLLILCYIDYGRATILRRIRFKYQQHYFPSTLCNTQILSVCMTGYGLDPWRSYRHETGIITFSMT